MIQIQYILRHHTEIHLEGFDRIITEGLIHQFRDNIDFPDENLQKDEVRRFETHS